MRIKSCPVRIKAAGDHEGTDEGVFEAIVAVFGNIDSYGDKILPGAFTDSLDEWAAKGDPIPVWWSHRMDNPANCIGEVLEAKETDEGLWVRAQLDLGTEPADQVYRLLKGRRVTQFSFSYDVDEGAWVDPEDGPGFYELRKLRLFEVGPTPIGANQETELLDVKSAAERAVAAIKAGRVLSEKNESALKGALDKIADGTRDIKSVLDAVDTSDDSKASPVQPATQGTPDGDVSGAPARPGPASARLLADLAAFGEAD